MGVRAAASYSRTAPRLGVSFLLADAATGEIIYEEYPNGGSALTATETGSAAKLFMGPLIQAMAEDGYWDGLCRSVARYLDHWNAPGYNAIAIRDLAWFSSGLIADNDHIGGQGTALVSNYYEHVRRYPLDPHTPNPISFSPNTIFRYGPSHLTAIGEAMRQTFVAQGLPFVDPLDYLTQRFFTPLGISVADWDRDPAGNPHMPNGAFITARNWLRWGMFMAGDGTVPAGSIGTLSVGSKLLAPQRLNVIRTGGPTNPGHGYSCWLNTPGGFDGNGYTGPGPSGFLYSAGEPNAIAGVGYGQNVIMWLPDEDRFGATNGVIMIRQATGEPPGQFSVNAWVTWFKA